MFLYWTAHPQLHIQVPRLKEKIMDNKNKIHTAYQVAQLKGDIQIISGV